MRAWRTRASSNGGFLWLMEMRSWQFQSLSWTVIWSPSAATRSSRCFGAKPRNSIAAWSPRIALIRTAVLGAEIALKPSR